MSYLKFSTGLFLEKLELQRMKKFLDDEGFRYFLLANSLRFGLIKRQHFYTDIQNSGALTKPFEFLNGLVTEGAALSLDYNEISAINSDGQLLYLPAGNIVTNADNNWY